jgi:hypothetical protein
LGGGFGAQPCVPARKEIEVFLAKQKDETISRQRAANRSIQRVFPLNNTNK